MASFYLFSKSKICICVEFNSEYELRYVFYYAYITVMLFMSVNSGDVAVESTL